jgi:hypothetical protein
MTDQTISLQNFTCDELKKIGKQNGVIMPTTYSKTEIFNHYLSLGILKKKISELHCQYSRTDKKEVCGRPANSLYGDIPICRFHRCVHGRMTSISAEKKKPCQYIFKAGPKNGTICRNLTDILIGKIYICRLHNISCKLSPDVIFRKDCIKHHCQYILKKCQRKGQTCGRETRNLYGEVPICCFHSISFINSDSYKSLLDKNERRVSEQLSIAS